MFSKTNYIVNLKNLKHNVSTIRSVVGKNVKICGIVKANAYGMGMPSVVNAICDYVDYFAVANVDEAVELRVVDKHTPVLVLGEVNLDAIDWCASHNVCVTVSSVDELIYISNHLGDKPLGVHLAVNTGLNRIGFCDAYKFKEALDVIRSSDKISLVGCYTHFATKQNDEKFIEKQYNLFEKYIKLLPKGVIVHCANSYTTLNYKSHYLDMVRPGFALYGQHKCDYNLKRVLSIESEIVCITNVKVGDTIGYDRTCVATRNMKVAVVPVGYADGLDRRLSNKFYLLVNGSRAPIVGNICMDVVLIDVTHIPYVYVGSKVTILGGSGNQILTPLDYATCLGTSAYEVLLKFNYRRMNYIVVDE